MLDLVMDGEIRAETDISVSPPDHSRKEGQATVQTLPRKSFWRGGQAVETAYIPASSIRGALRNGASRAVAAARAARQSPMTPEDFLLVAKGGVKDRKQAGSDERVVDWERAERLRRDEPLVSLFGAMAEKIGGRWQIGDAVPVEPLGEPARKGRGVRSHPFQRQPDLARFMDRRAYEAFLETDTLRVEANLAENEAGDLGRKIAAERRRAEPDAERVEAWRAEEKRLMQQAKDWRDKAGGAVNVQQVLGGWEAIPEGTRMRHRMRLRGATGDELAWAFFALRRLARDGRLGAHESSGEGYFSAEYALRLAIGEGGFEPAGRLRIADFALSLDGGAPALEHAFAASASLPGGGPDGGA